MKFLHSIGVLLTLSSMVCAVVTASKAGATTPPYSSYTVLDKPNKTDIGATSINSSGQIVGTYNDTQFMQHGFLRSPTGKFTKVDVPSAYPGTTAPLGINEFGVIVGSYQDGANYGERGFVLSNGVYSTFAVNLPSAVPNTTFAYGINDFGQIVGNYLGYEGRTHGFVLYNGVYTSFDIHSPGQGVNVNATLPAAINDLGQITGQYTTDVNGDFLTVASHGFILSGGATTTLDVPGALNGTYGAGTQASGINVLGQVVGQYVDTNGATHGFLYSCGTYKTLDAPNAPNTAAYGINALGQIVGYFDDGTYNGTNLHGFLLNP